MNHKLAQFPAELEGRLEEFDASWSRGNPPNIEDFLRLPDSHHVDSEQQRRLLAEVNAGVEALDAGEFTAYAENERARFRSHISAEAASRREASGS